MPPPQPRPPGPVLGGRTAYLLSFNHGVEEVCADFQILFQKTKPGTRKTGARVPDTRNTLHCASKNETLDLFNIVPHSIFPMGTVRTDPPHRLDPGNVKQEPSSRVEQAPDHNEPIKHRTESEWA